MNLTLQYIFVGLVLFGAAVYIVKKIITLRRKGHVDSCCGCSLSKTCDKNKHNTNTQCHENNKDME